MNELNAKELLLLADQLERGALPGRGLVNDTVVLLRDAVHKLDAAETRAVRAEVERDEAVVLLERLSCPNCSDQLCMSCRLRDEHDACADDCPCCCNAADSYYAAWVERRTLLARARALVHSIPTEEAK